jgi:transposase
MSRTSRVKSGKPERAIVEAHGGRRRFTEEFKAEAVQMLLDGHTVTSVCERLGLSGPNLLYRWKRELVHRGGTTAVGLEARVKELEGERLGPDAKADSKILQDME